MAGRLRKMDATSPCPAFCWWGFVWYAVSGLCQSAEIASTAARSTIGYRLSVRGAEVEVLTVRFALRNIRSAESAGSAVIPDVRAASMCH